MKQTKQNVRDDETTIRETFTEYRIGEDTVAVIKDPENDLAWILSTSSCSVRP